MFLYFSFCLFCNLIFPLDSQNPGNTVGRIEEALHTSTSLVVQASTSLVLPGSVLPQEVKLKLVHKLLTVSSRITQVLVYLLDRVVDTDLLSLYFWQEVLEQGSSQSQDDSELIALREQVKNLVREGYSLGEE
jgi:hypothetical protein